VGSLKKLKTRQQTPAISLTKLKPDGVNKLKFNLIAARRLDRL